MVEQKLFMSIKEFASYVGVHYNTVWRAIKTGRLNAFRLGEGKKSAYRIPISETHRLAFMNLEEMVNEIIERKK